MLISRNNILHIIILLSTLFIACNQHKELPLLGKKIVEGETVLHTIPDFSFYNQDSILIDNNSLKDNIYIADFFFTSCPTICPIVSQNMLSIQEVYKNEDLLKLVSYTIDPKRDTPKRLKNYAFNLGADTKQWHFLTGPADTIYELADAYWVSAYEDKSAPGGFDHSGKILLVDKDRHIRSFCDGTKKESVNRFIKDIQTLIDEYKVK